MTADTLDTRLSGTVTVDHCGPCQLFWFDVHESLQLSPAATLTLFKIVGEQASQPRPAPLKGARCPRCRFALVRTHDMQRNTKFEYWRCDREHGRLITFYDFLREKDFIRPLTEAQIAELRERVESVNCSNCGAPVNLVTGATCAHCGSPLSMLDLPHAERLIAELQQAGNPDRPSPAGAEAASAGHAALVPLALALDRSRTATAGSTDLVGDGLTTLLRRLLSL